MESLKIPGFIFTLLILLTACGDHPGYEEKNNGTYKKLHSFGDCEGILGQSDYGWINVFVEPVDYYDTTEFFQVFISRLDNEDQSVRIDTSLFGEIKELRCGDSVSYITPYSFFRNTFLDQYNGDLFEPATQVRLTMKIKKTFDEKSFLEYAMAMCRVGKMDEGFLLAFCLANRDEVEQHGKIFIETLVPGSSDTIRAGDEIIIDYRTYLLDGTVVDEPTNMTFSFGRPGQLVSGFQYGLSKMTYGETARIYVPSFLGFGESGSSSGLIPPRTPLYFEVSVGEKNTDK